MLEFQLPRALQKILLVTPILLIGCNQPPTAEVCSELRSKQEAAKNRYFAKKIEIAEFCKNRPENCVPGGISKQPVVVKAQAEAMNALKRYTNKCLLSE